MEERKKASAVHAEANYLFGEKVSFAKAFPTIETVKVVVEESGAGARGHARQYDQATLGEFIDCSNPLCYKGGFSLGGVLRRMVEEKQTHLKDSASCQGYEGSPKGKKKYRECGAYFTFTVDIAYKSAK